MTLLAKVYEKFRYEFYFCFDISYHDSVLNRNFSYVRYAKYSSIRGAFSFAECTNQESKQIDTILNSNFMKSGERLFGQ